MPARASSRTIWSIRSEVGVAERAELTDWRTRKSHVPKKVLNYVLLALLPILIFGLLLWVARHA